MTANPLTVAQPATAQAAAASGPATTAAPAPPQNPNGVLGQNDFLKLMVAQLQAQNPLEPGNSNEFINELAQFTQVEQVTNLATVDQLASAVQLIGHSVTYNGGSGALSAGVVESVQSDSSGTTITVGGVSGVKLASITEVQ